MMRPIVKAVGLICILAHDYLIVKMEMLFWYPVAVIDHKGRIYLHTAEFLIDVGDIKKQIIICNHIHLHIFIDLFNEICYNYTAFENVRYICLVIYWIIVFVFLIANFFFKGVLS